MMSIPNRRRRLLFCGATAKEGHERLEQGALTLGALAVLTAIWLGIGLPSLPSVFSHQSAYENESPLVAYTNDPAQPRPHAAPSGPLVKTEAVRRQSGKPAPHLVQATSASGRRATAAAARDAARWPAASQAAPRPETAAAPQATTTTNTTTTTQTSTTETPGPPAPPPVTVPPLPPVPPVPTVTVPQVPQTPPLPAVEPPSQLPTVPTQTQTLPNLP